jgi:hypothetical protein
MIIYRSSLAILLPALALSGCNSSPPAFTCVGRTYDSRSLDGPPLLEEKITFVILDANTIQRFEGNDRYPPQKAQISESDIVLRYKSDGEDTRIQIDRVKGSGVASSKQGDFLFMTTLSGCVKDAAPDIESKI